MPADTYTAACGHAVPYPPGVARWSTRKWSAYRARHVCKACYAHDAQESTVRESRKLGLRLLSGTDRQVAWAYRLRLEGVYSALTHLCGYVAFDPVRDAATVRMVVAEANKRATAGQWIAIRSDTAGALLVALGYGAEVDGTIERYATAPF